VTTQMEERRFEVANDGVVRTLYSSTAGFWHIFRTAEQFAQFRTWYLEATAHNTTAWPDWYAPTTYPCAAAFGMDEANHILTVFMTPADLEQVLAAMREA
jgi:hypothetical protein